MPRPRACRCQPEVFESVRLTRPPGTLLSAPMIGRRLLGMAALVGLALVVACTGQPVGRICDLGGSQAPAPGESVVASPSLDCVTRTCLRVPATNPNPPKGSMPPTGTSGLCTAECSTADDCERVPESPCISGFTCAIPVTVGPFCCKKFCICKDYVQYPPSGQPLPMACDPSDAANTCCNLSGRKDNPMYPLCHS